MSDAPQGEGTWQASDGKWYPPEQHPDRATSILPPPAPSLPPSAPAKSNTHVLERTNAPPGGGKRKKSKRPLFRRWWFILLVFIAAVVALSIALAPDSVEDGFEAGLTPDRPIVTLLAQQIPLVTPEATHEEIEVNEGDFGEEWPLTVDHGLVVCESWPSTYERLAVFFVDPSGTVYAVNGTARDTIPEHGWAEIDPIWKPDPEIDGVNISIQPLIEAGLEICESAGVAPDATDDASFTADDVRNLIFPISFDSSRQEVLDILNELVIVESVDNYVYDTETGTVRLNITPAFDFDEGVRDDTWEIMRAMSEFWRTNWVEPSTQWSPALNVSITTAEYECTSEQMRLMADARFTRADWENSCRVR